ncbi:MAG: DUF423 domain-containing protein [Pseudopedobacter saltans]|uniref:DUF423 domain-containing protein n=1 Tax=Pseudopedobacter saltans TaxID=151895 RepID=A0A2W5F0E3_9SPHI|nr:MAG: DUF423 domain-containing protein [Pseudopedobacter saltans]
MRLTAFLGAITVALGAYSAHGLKSKVAAPFVEIFQTGVQYQFYHVIVLLIACYLYGKYDNGKLYAAIVLFFVGILLFSGSLYALTFVAAYNIKSFDWLGPVTPVGGLAFMAGWVMLGLGIKPSSKKYRKSSKVDA